MLRRIRLRVQFIQKWRGLADTQFNKIANRGAIRETATSNSPHRMGAGFSFTTAQVYSIEEAN